VSEIVVRSFAVLAREQHVEHLAMLFLSNVDRVAEFIAAAML